MKLNSKFILFSLLVCACITSQSNSTVDIIQNLDKKFWKAYNSCNDIEMKKYLDKDIEFYHDVNGLTVGSEKLISSIKKNLCSNKKLMLTRKAVKGSVKIYPLKNYGAIITGDHEFYRTEDKHLTGIAKFTHVWVYKNKQWKMSRILSYDHKTPSHDKHKKEILLSDTLLDRYSGNYLAPKSGNVTISKKGKMLFMVAGKMKANIYAQSDNIFFHKEAPLTFEFVLNQDGTVNKMVVRENGKIAEEALRKN